MFAPIFELDAFEVIPIEDRIAALGAMLEALAEVNRAYLRQFPRTPALYDAGVRYRPERPGTPNRWQDIPRAMALGGTHCVGLSAWRVAELREREREPALFRVHVYTEPDARSIEYHVLVIRSDGSCEDPSRKLGLRLIGE